MARNHVYLEYRDKWVNNPKYHIVEKAPLHLDIELTNRCNLTCPECPYHSIDSLGYTFPIGDMDFDLYKRIIKEAGSIRVKAIKLNFAGEPLLYPLLAKAISYAKKNRILEVMINTNATLLTPDLIIDLIRAGLDVVIISDYKYPTQWNNTKTLHEIRGKHPSPKIIVKTNVPEYWKAISDQQEPLVFYDYNHPKYDPRISDYECSQPWQRFLILNDGTILKCSCGITVNDKILGNIESTSISEVWHSEMMEFLRFCHERHCSHLIKACALCPGRSEYIDKKVIS